MATVHSILTNFTAGELSPRLYGRIDVAKYQNGARDLTNFIVLPQGGARKRSGTKFIASVKVPDGLASARLVAFTFSTTQSYILEFGAFYIRFYKDQGQIYDVSFSISAVGFGPTTTLTIGTNTLNVNDRVIINGVTGTTQLNNREFVVSAVAGSVITIKEVDNFGVKHDVNSTTYNSYTGGGVVNRIYEVSTVYDATTVADMTFTQSADTLYIFNGTWPLALLTRSAHASWTLETANVEEGPFLDMNIDEDNTVSIDIAAGTGGVMTFSKDTLEAAHLGALWRIWEYANGATFGYATWAPGATVTVANGSFWEYKGNVYYVVSGGGQQMASTASYPTHTKGTAEVFYGTGSGIALMRYEHSGFAVVQITEVVDTQNAIVDVVKNRVPYTAYGSRSSFQWQEGAWSDKRGYPKTGTFHEQRLVAAATENQPSTIWGSVVNAYLKFKDSDKDDESYTYTISSDQVDAVKFMASTKRLALLATSAEYIVQATSVSEPITPTNIKISRETSFGTSNVHPVRAGPAIIFAQRAGLNENPARRLREFVYNFQTDSYLAPDLTILSDHITLPGLVDGAFTATPDMQIWYCRSDGVAVCMTYERDQQVVGWHKHHLGGTGDVVKMASVPGVNADELWMIVERILPGALFSTQRYIEVMSSGLPEGAALETAWFVDCGLNYTGAPTASVSGLWHLNGETISALCDGEPVHNLVVSGGRISLPHACTKITVGYSYTSLLKTLHIEAGAQAGTAQGRLGRVYEIIARLNNSVGGKFGMDDSKKLDPIRYREADTPLPPAIGLFNGDMVLPFDGDWDRDRYVTIQHDEPLPFTLTALMISQRVSG